MRVLGPLGALAVSLLVFGLLARSGEPSARAARVARLPPLPGPAATTEQRIVALQARIRAGAQPAPYADLGAAYLQRVRETGDTGYYARAGGALAIALQRHPRDEAAVVDRGTLALARHDFRAALADGQRARALAPDAAAPLPVIVDALVELGRYGEAGRALQQLLDRKPGLPAYARASYFRELHGDLGGAASAMRLAVSAGSSTPEGAAYVQTLLGTLEFNRGRLRAARAAYVSALRAVPGFPAAAAGRARIDAANGRLDRAERALRRVVDRRPLPEYVVALGETELAAGLPRRARDDLALVAVERRLLAANGVDTDVELALFEADHGSPRRGVALGRRAWAAAPSVRSADALGWALTRAGRPAEGDRWARRALRLGWREPLALYHAGMSARAAGRRGAARALLSRLIAQAPRFSPLYAPRAERALAQLR